MSGTPVRDWLEPRVRALVADAVKQGFGRAAVVAVLGDIAMGPDLEPMPAPEISHAPIPASGPPTPPTPEDPPFGPPARSFGDGIV